MVARKRQLPQGPTANLPAEAPKRLPDGWKAVHKVYLTGPIETSWSDRAYARLVKDPKAGDLLELGHFSIQHPARIRPLPDGSLMIKLEGEKVFLIPPEGYRRVESVPLKEIRAVSPLYCFNCDRNSGQLSSYAVQEAEYKCPDCSGHWSVWQWLDSLGAVV